MKLIEDPPAILQYSGALKHIEDYAATLANPNTRDAYLRVVYRFLAWCDHFGIKDLRDLKPFHAFNYLQQFEKPRTRQLHYAAGKHFFYFCMENNISANPFSQIRPPRTPKQINTTAFLKEGELRVLFGACDPLSLIGIRDRALIAVLFYAVSRATAAIQLRPCDIVQEGKETWITFVEKNLKIIKKPASPELVGFLMEYQTKAGLDPQSKKPLFRSIPGRAQRVTGRGLSRQNVYDRLRFYQRKTKLLPGDKLTPHVLRVSGINYLLGQNVEPQIVQWLAGHEHLQTTLQHYDRRIPRIPFNEVVKVQKLLS